MSGPRLHRRVETEIGTELGVSYLDLTAIRPIRLGVANVGLWAPRGAAWLSLAIALTSTIQLTTGARVEGMPGRDATRDIRYCDPICGPTTMETWHVGGVGYGVDVGLRLRLR